MRVLIKCFKRQVNRTFVAIAALAQSQIDHLRRWDGRFQCQFCTLGKGLRQANENFPVVQGACRLGQYGPVEAGDIAHSQQVEGAVVMVVFQC
ncbi:hypothetical protein D3C76_1554060 [compost metagenome]